MLNLKKFISEKIASLAGVKSQKSKLDPKLDGFFVDSNELCHFYDDNTLHLQMNEACKKKIGSALKAEARASFDKKHPDWVTLKFENEMDCEFIFLYIRYAAMSWRNS